MLKRFKHLAADANVVFAPIQRSQRLRILLLASAVTLLELSGFALIAAAITTLGGDVPPVVADLIDSGVSALGLTIVAFALFIARGLVTGFYQWWVLGIMNTGEKTTVVSYVRGYLSLPFQEQVQTGSSEVLKTVRISIGRSYQMFGIGAVDLMAEIPAIGALFVVVFLLAPGAALAVVAFVVLSALAFQRTAGRQLLRLGTEHEEVNALDFQLLLQIANGTRELVVRQVEGTFLGRLSKNRDHLVTIQRQIAFLKASARLYLEVLFVLGLGVVLVVVGLSADRSVALSVVGVFAVAGFRALPSAARILLGLANVQSGRAPLEQAADRLRNFKSSRPTAATNLTRREPKSGSPGRIELVDVWFRYESQLDPVLRGLSLGVEPGRSIAFVGRSGAGKTTLVDVMLGLLKPNRGQVLVNGRPLDEETVKNWRKQTALVPQDVFLIDASIAENVRFGFDDDGEAPSVSDCLRRAQLWNEIDTLPDGVDTLVGSRGTTLSGGQRQRLGIARALYMNPSVVFMDEATSALDTVTELALAEALESLRGEVTTITVAHRLSTVRRCDVTAFIEDGHIIDMGSYDELRQRCKPFRDMVNAAESFGGLFPEEPR